ncbi:rab-like protein 3 [Sycon ciliatum]|uniref:rab-like protein 3 n=1 Tax=Sycon ciliatum TaxID=27933 RepID=UPI0031F6ADF6|eukprot:scpid73542/ scgid16469/ Rab-like protein 3
MADVDRVRILVVGDSGVGKSSLVHLICHDEPLLKSSWTVGCSVDVKLYETSVAQGTTSKTFCIELWEIGGFSGHKGSRSIFYQPCHGLILVHDLTNWKSHANLSKWLTEVTQADQSGTDGGLEAISTDSEHFGADLFPVLIIGTKLDQVGGVGSLPRRNALTERTGADSLCVDCLNERQFSPGSAHRPQLHNFFNKVIESRFSQRNASSVDRRRTSGLTR